MEGTARVLGTPGQNDKRPWTASEFTAAVDGLDPIVLRVAATLGISDSIAAGHDTTGQLAHALRCEPEGLARIMKYLMVRDVFEECEDERFVLGEYGRLLLDTHPSGLRRWLTTTGPGARLDSALSALTDSIRHGEASYPKIHGNGFYDDAAKPTENGDTFNELRAKHGAVIAEQLACLPLWSQVNHVVDIGGGEGRLISALLTSHPHLHGTLVDLKPAVEAAHVRLHSAGILSRCTLVARSIFDGVPSSADIYVLSNVLHNWSDERVCQILSGCREGRGRVLIVEALVDRIDQRVATSMDLRMLAFCGGKERTTGEFESLLRTERFKPSEIVAVSAELFAIAASPV